MNKVLENYKEKLLGTDRETGDQTFAFFCKLSKVGDFEDTLDYYAIDLAGKFWIPTEICEASNFATNNPRKVININGMTGLYPHLMTNISESDIEQSQMVSEHKQLFRIVLSNQRVKGAPRKKILQEYDIQWK